MAGLLDFPLEQFKRRMSWNYCVDLITEVTLPHTQLSYLLLSQVGSLRPICNLGGAAWKLTC